MLPINLKRKKFERLRVISYDKTKAGSGHGYWWCKCSCGKIKSIRANHLKSGNTKSCGCYSGDIGREFLTIYANSEAHQGPNNPSWKGDKAKYSTFHSWLARYAIKKFFCEHCFKNKKLDWALKKGREYSRNSNDYLQLCRGCHIKYDEK